MEALELEIRRFVVDNFLFGQDDESLSNSDSFLERGIVDSTGVLELVQFLEQHYEIKIEDEDMVPENLDTIKSVARLIQAKRS